MKRRGFLKAGGLSLVGWAVRPRTALSSISVRSGQHGPDGDVLVSIFLRGGADGLNVVVPYGDDHYYRNRPTLAQAHPTDARSKPSDRVIDLDGYFGLHPALAPLRRLYEAGQMGVVHACGSGDQTRSHFEAMATIERGLDRETGPASGWLARHLESAPWDNVSPLRAVAIGAMVPESLGGASNTIALQKVSELRLQVPFTGRGESIAHSLAEMYGEPGGGDRGLLMEAGREALSVLKSLENLSPGAYAPANGAIYPKDDLGDGLGQVALLMKSGVGLEAACLDHGSFDTHVAQDALLGGKLASLAQGLSAFATDLGPNRWGSTTVVVLSEFGRRVEENGGAGTDHGRGGVAMVLGGKAAIGGKVHGRWPGLAPEQLEGPGDLRVTTDYRNVLSEVIEHRLKNPNIDAIFPGLSREPVGVVRAG